MKTRAKKITGNLILLVLLWSSCLAAQQGSRKNREKSDSSQPRQSFHQWHFGVSIGHFKEDAWDPDSFFRWGAFINLDISRYVGVVVHGYQMRARGMPENQPMDGSYVLGGGLKLSLPMKRGTIVSELCSLSRSKSDHRGGSSFCLGLEFQTTQTNRISFICESSSYNMNFACGANTDVYRGVRVGYSFTMD